jgi:hypothetical protein
VFVLQVLVLIRHIRPQLRHFLRRLGAREMHESAELMVQKSLKRSKMIQSQFLIESKFSRE